MAGCSAAWQGLARAHRSAKGRNPFMSDIPIQSGNWDIGEIAEKLRAESFFEEGGGC